MNRLIPVLALACTAYSAAGIGNTAAGPLPGASVVAAAPPIAYVVARGYGDQRRFQLVAADADGTNPRVILASREPLMSPAWSPDGRAIAYASYQDRRSAIFVIDLATQTPRLLVQEQGVNGAPAWSPDGRLLAVSLSLGVNADLYVIDVASGLRRRLTTHPAIDTEPTWSPDGRSIAFTSDRSGLPQIYLVDAQGGPERRVSYAGRKNMRPAYSPSGRAIAYVSYEGARSRIGVLSLTDGSVSYVSNGPMDESPSFAPDGGSLIYVDVRAGRLAVVGLDRRPLRSIPQEGDISEVAWCAPSAATVVATAEASGEAQPAPVDGSPQTPAEPVEAAQAAPVLDPMPVSFDAP